MTREKTPPRDANDGDPVDVDPGDDEALTDRVEAALRSVRDPELDVDVFEAGLVEDVRTEGRTAVLEADLGEFRPGESDAVSETMERAVSDVPGVERAHVEDATRPVDTDDRDTGVAGADRVVAVASAKGGVGKTTVTANLACALADDESVGAFDADIHGPNLPELLGVSGPVYSDDDGNPLPVERDGLEVMSVGLMESGAPLAWRGSMAHDALSELFEDTAWNDRETLVVDLPPGTGDVVLTTLQDVPVDGVVVVTTPFHAAVTDTRRSIELFRENDVPVLGVVVNMGSFECPTCGDSHELYPGESPVSTLEAPVLAELPFSPEFQGEPAPGDVPDAFHALAKAVNGRYAEVWDVTVPEGAVDLRGVPAERRHDRVRQGFTDLESGEEFVIVSDRDPSPVREFLVELAGVDAGEFDRFEVRQQNPETWMLRTMHP